MTNMSGWLFAFIVGFAFWMGMQASAPLRVQIVDCVAKPPVTAR